MKNNVYLIRRVVQRITKDNINVGGPHHEWYSLQGWVDKRRVATHFSTRAKADSALLLIAAERPEWIGLMEVVRLTRRWGIAVDV